MSKKILMAPSVALCLLAAGCGGADQRSASAGNSTDRAFVAKMVPHHRSAVEMADIAVRRGQSALVKRLAGEIVRTQNAEIATMREVDAELADDGVKNGDLGVGHSMMGMDGDTAALTTADPFDPAFVEMMIPHHEGAITMAQAELAKGQNAELKKLAEAIISAQSKEIGEMRAFTA